MMSKVSVSSPLAWYLSSLLEGVCEHRGIGVLVPGLHLQAVQEAVQEVRRGTFLRQT